MIYRAFTKRLEEDELVLTPEKISTPYGISYKVYGTTLEELAVISSLNIGSAKMRIDLHDTDNMYKTTIELTLLDPTVVLKMPVYLYGMDDTTFEPMMENNEVEMVSDKSQTLKFIRKIDDWWDYVRTKNIVLLNYFPEIVLNESTTILNEAAVISKSKRKQIEDLIYSVMSTLDKSGKNTEKYKSFYSKMDDKTFSNYMDKFFKNDKENFYLELFPFESEPKLNDIKKAADILKVPLDEYMYMPFENPNGPAPRTPTPCMTGWIHGKVLQQVSSKKNSSSVEATYRNPKTGQVQGKDKNGRITDVDNFALNSIGADYALKEFLGFRADDINSKEAANQSINMYGYVDIDKLPNNIEDKRALNTLNIYFLGAMIVTDLVPLDTLFNAGQEAKQYNRSKYEDA